MSRAVRLAGAVALACASVPLAGVGTAHADTVKLPASNAGYFNASGIDKPEQSPQPVPNAPAAADGVSPENLAVAAKGGTEDKVSFLYFGLFNLPAGVTIEKAVVSLPLVPLSPTDVSSQAAPEKVQACKAGDKGFSGDDGANLQSSAPERLCAAFKAVGKASADSKAYEFDITALAQSWIAGANDGVAFTVADAAVSSNFQVVFGKAADTSLALTYTAPAVVTPPVTTPVDTGVVTTPVDTGSGFTPGPDTGGFGTVTTPDLGSAPVVPTPTVGEVPEPVAPTVALPAAQNVAALTPSMRPTAGFWLTGLALAAVLALLSLVFGDTRVPAAQTSRSRLSAALAQRERQGLRGPGLRALPI